MDNQFSDYGLWSIVILNSIVFLFFLFSFTKPKTSHDWRSFGMISAFIVALFVEMYGFPLTIYLFSGILSRWLPGFNLLTHNSGHLLEDLFGWGGDPHFGPFHIASYVFIISGFVLLSKAWGVLYKAQKEKTLAVNGPYAKIRHPQYVAFALIMFGFLLQWPTILTLVMFPILLFVYIQLAKKEERGSKETFGSMWDEYVKQTNMFIPMKKLMDKN